MSSRTRDLITLTPCGCDLCFHCLTRLLATKSGLALMHCGQQVESQNSVRTVKKRNRDVAFEDVSVLYPEIKKPKPPPMTETLKFARGVIRDGTSSSKVGDGVLVTEQTLLEQDKDAGGIKSVNVGFSVIDRNGQKIDDATKDSIAQVFKNLSAALMKCLLQCWVIVVTQRVQRMSWHI